MSNGRIKLDRNNPSLPCQWKNRERLLLAPYAMFSEDSRGRRYEEAIHPYRSPFQRDRDRILHSAAFRRLSGKMQVFTGDMGDYHRTRLTHTHEVATIARTIGRVLRLNEDLIEALALLHDIGHPPFGHSGEDALSEAFAEHGGFSHNDFALTLVEELETRYTTYPGLNLTTEVLSGQQFRITHSGPSPLLEVQVVDVADSLAYNAHDVDDALALLETAVEKLDPVKQLDSTSVCELGIVLELSPTLASEREQLSSFLFENVYRHPDLVRIRERAARRVGRLVSHLMERPQLLPVRFLDRAQRVGVAVAVRDYIAGMTDRFCDAQFTSLIELGEGHGLDW